MAGNEGGAVWQPKSLQERTPGTSNWWLFSAEDIPKVEAASREWRAALDGVARPWLCWCVNDKWCVLQQKLVLKAGWTPVVGHDTNIHMPTLVDGSLYVDFNKHFKYRKMYMHFPMEWVYRHSDCGTGLTQTACSQARRMRPSQSTPGSWFQCSTEPPG